MNALMGAVIVVVSLPQSEGVALLCRRAKPMALKAFFVIGSIGVFNHAIAPRTGFGNQGMDATGCLNRFSERGFTLRMSGIFHREGHGIVSPDDQKGGKCSKARLNTAATVRLRLSG